eukprot:1193080-Prorocentrum_minimum.AAC.3
MLPARALPGCAGRGVARPTRPPPPRPPAPTRCKLTQARSLRTTNKGKKKRTGSEAESRALTRQTKAATTTA